LALSQPFCVLFRYPTDRKPKITPVLGRFISQTLITFVLDELCD